MSRAEDLDKKKKQVKPSPPSTKEGTAADAGPKKCEEGQKQVGPNFINVFLWGRKSRMKSIYDGIIELMRCGEPAEVLKDAPEVKNTVISNSGIAHDGCFSQFFVPWRAVTSIDWEKPLCGKGEVCLTDRVGSRVTLANFNEEAYTKFRHVYASHGLASQNASRGGDEKPAVVRKNLRIEEAGVSVGTKHCLSYSYKFYPWQIVDACELDTSCCTTKLILITETGDRIPVYSAWNFFGKRAMVEILRKLREMKYQLKDGDTDHDAMWFAGAPGKPNSCVLTKASVKISVKPSLCKRLTCELDLDSVERCTSVQYPKDGCCRNNYLVIQVAKRMGSAMAIDDALLKEAQMEHSDGQNRLVIKLCKRDNPTQLAHEMNARIAARKKQESSF